MVVGIYCRFSSDNNKNQSNESISHQRKNGIDFCDRKGYTYKVYEDVISGGRLMEDRDGGSRLISDLQNDSIDGIWVDKEDRLYRDFNESTIFKYNYIKKTNKRYFIGDSEVDFDDDSNNIVNTVLSLMSDMEKKNINRRTKRGTITHLKNGKPIGRVSYGYKKDDNKQWVIDEESSKNVIKCYRLFVDKNFSTVRDWMRHCNLILGWNRSTMWYYDLYRKQIYNGVKFTTYDNVEYKSNIPKIVTNSLYNKFSKKFKHLIENTEGNNRKTDFDNILSGLVYCKKCKGKLNIANNRHQKRMLRCVYGSKSHTSLYVNKSVREIEKHTSTLNYEDFKDLVYKMLIEILFNSNIVKDEFKRLYKGGIDTNKVKSEIQKLKRQLKGISKREMTLEENLIDGFITKENVVKHRERIQLDRIQIEGMIYSLEDDINKHSSTNRIVRWIDKFKTEYSYKNMIDKTDKQKKEILQKYIKRVELIGSKSDFDLSLTLNIPIIDDKIKLNKKSYWEYVNNGGVKKDWKKEWSVGRGVRETSLKQLVTKQSNICLNNRNFNKFIANLNQAFFKLYFVFS